MIGAPVPHADKKFDGFPFVDVEVRNQIHRFDCNPWAPSDPRKAYVPNGGGAASSFTMAEHVRWALQQPHELERPWDPPEDLASAISFLVENKVEDIDKYLEDKVMEFVWDFLRLEDDRAEWVATLDEFNDVVRAD